MGEGILTYKGAVQAGEIDSNRHMNVMYYINKFEMAGRNCSLEFGISKEYLEKNEIGIAVVEQNIQYKREVYEDDLLYVMSKPVSHTNKIIEFEHKLFRRNDEVLSAIMKAKIIFFSLSDRKSVSIPLEMIEKVKAYLDD